MDVLTRAQRRYNMSRIKGRDTTPERAVRSAAHRLGFRFRLHDRGLPGSPDLVFKNLRACVFVHGCFWHRHKCRNGQVVPATRREFWERKLAGNVERDRCAITALRRSGWRVLVVWECQTRRGEPALLEAGLTRFLNEVGRSKASFKGLRKQHCKRHE